MVECIGMRRSDDAARRNVINAYSDGLTSIFHMATIACEEALLDLIEMTSDDWRWIGWASN